MDEKIINWQEVDRIMEAEKNKNIKDILLTLELVVKDAHVRHVLREVILDKFNNFNRFNISKMKELSN